MPKIRDTTLTKPVFPDKALDQLEKEIKQAGGFDKLMLEKHAIKKQDGETVIMYYHPDIENYKEQYLTGAYAPLKTINCHIPFALWTNMHDALLTRKSKKIKNKLNHEP